MSRYKSVIRTERIWLKSCPQLRFLCHLSKNLYNEANYLVRQEFFNHNKWIRYNSLYHLLKTSDNYHLLPAQTAQQVLKILDRNWKSFFGAINEWKKDKSKFNGRPNPPRYKPKNGEFMLVFTNQQVKLKDNFLLFPKKVGLKIKTRLPDRTDIREVRIIPKGVGYVVEMIYQKEISPKPLNKDKIVAIDIGVRNLITTVNNNGLKPFVIKGGIAKSINQYYNKERARIQSTYDRQGIKTGKTMQKLTIKRNRKINEFFHKTSQKIIEYCVRNDIGTIVIGYNPEWKQNCKIGKKNTQNFVSIPYNKLIQQLEYKAAEQGIMVIKQEESFSSKCSFLDNESIEHHRKYLGRRITRGLFKSLKGTIINADVNGAYNIMKKAFLNAVNADRIEDVGLHPTRWRLAAVTS
ncbi:MAG: RNA-guided endonuclease InsQ/TnpB family protein [Promethearchaeota archaeon]